MRGAGLCRRRTQESRKEKRKSQEIQKQILQSIECFHNAKHKFKRLHEAWCMLQELKQDKNRKGITF